MTLQSAWRRFDLYRVTLSHLRPSQMAHRAHRLIRNRVMGLLPPRPPQPGAMPAHIERPFAMAVAVPPSGALEVVAGRFRFLDLPPVDMPVVDWRHAPGDRLLWLYYLHYFGWGVELAQAWLASGDAVYAERAAALMAAWIDENPKPRGPGWHPYPTSRRLHAWTLMVAAMQDASAFRSVLPAVMGAVEQQAAYLHATCEYDVRGNHLLANLHALAWVHLVLGPSLPDALNSTIAPRLAEFWAEFLAQTRPDGSHEENTLSYQLTVCQDAFETLVLMERQGAAPPAGVLERLEAMFSHLATMLTPDGAMPMVNDTLQGYPMAPGPFLVAGACRFGRGDWLALVSEADWGYARWLFGAGVAPPPAAVPVETSFGHSDAGYYVVRGGWGPNDDYLLFDCGPLGPRHLMAHAHADTLAVELHAFGRAIVVDPGVYEYPAGRWRDHFRSTAAHNTVAVDGQDQSEVWASFRVARRAEATLTAWIPGEFVEGEHDGYRRLIGRVRHRRAVHRLGEGRWCVADTLRSQGGVHHYELTWQLAQGGRVTKVADSVVCVDHGGVQSRFQLEGPAGLDVAIETGWVSHTWNQKAEAPVIKARLVSAAPEVRLVTHVSVTPEVNAWE